MADTMSWQGISEGLYSGQPWSCLGLDDSGHWCKKHRIHLSTIIFIFDHSKLAPLWHTYYILLSPTFVKKKKKTFEKKSIIRSVDIMTIFCDLVTLELFELTWICIYLSNTGGNLTLSLIGFAVKVTIGCDSGGRCDWMQPDRLYTAFFFWWKSGLWWQQTWVYFCCDSSQSEGLNVFLLYISVSFLPLTLVHYLV